MKNLLLTTICLLLAAPAFAQSTSMQSPAYQECSALAGTNAVCRIYIPPNKGDGHYFGRDQKECDGTMAKNPGFILESSTFLYLYPTSAGACASTHA